MVVACSCRILWPRVDFWKFSLVCPLECWKSVAGCRLWVYNAEIFFVASGRPFAPVIRGTKRNSKKVFFGTPYCTFAKSQRQGSTDCTGVIVTLEGRGPVLHLNPNKIIFGINHIICFVFSLFEKISLNFYVRILNTYRLIFSNTFD